MTRQLYLLACLAVAAISGCGSRDEEPVETIVAAAPVSTPVPTPTPDIPAPPPPPSPEQGSAASGANLDAYVSAFKRVEDEAFAVLNKPWDTPADVAARRAEMQSALDSYKRTPVPPFMATADSLLQSGVTRHLQAFSALERARQSNDQAAQDESKANFSAAGDFYRRAGEEMRRARDAAILNAPLPPQ